MPDCILYSRYLCTYYPPQKVNVIIYHYAEIVTLSKAMTNVVRVANVVYACIM